MARPNFDRLYPKTQGEWTGKKKPPTEHEKKAQAVPQKELDRVKGIYDRSQKRVDRAKAAAQAVKAERAALPRGGDQPGVHGAVGGARESAQMASR